MSPELECIGTLAQADPKLRFTAVAHHIDEEFLREVAVYARVSSSDQRDQRADLDGQVARVRVCRVRDA